MGRSEHFFHGTRRDLEGDTLLPAREFGDSNYNYSDSEFDGHGRTRRANYVYAGESESMGWEWASGSGRERVHVVNPVGDVKPDTMVKGAVAMPKAKVADTIWTPPFDAWRAEYSNNDANFDYRVERPGKTTPMMAEGSVQGTLPPLNWNQHKVVGHPASPLVKRLAERFEPQEEEPPGVHEDQQSLFPRATYRR